jgi:hypothetical protein
MPESQHERIGRNFNIIDIWHADAPNLIKSRFIMNQVACDIDMNIKMTSMLLRHG